MRKGIFFFSDFLQCFRDIYRLVECLATRCLTQALIVGATAPRTPKTSGAAARTSHRRRYIQYSKRRADRDVRVPESWCRVTNGNIRLRMRHPSTE